jgi:type 1 glutamine amidotransferase
MTRIFRSPAAAARAVGVAGLFAGDAARAADPSPAKPAELVAGAKLKVLLVTGGCCHDYGRQKQILEQGISARAPVEFTTVHEGDGITGQRHSVYEKPDWWKGYDLVIHDECSADVKDLAFIKNILAAHEAGVPAVVLHCGMHNYRSEGFPKAVTPWFEFTGLQTTGHGQQLPIAIAFVDKESPITKGLEDWKTVNEELYNNIAGDVLPTAHALAKGKQARTVYPKKDGKEDKSQPGKEVVDETIVAWTNDYKGKAKVFATTIGHNNDTVGDARYLNLVTRGLLWAAGRSADFKASDVNVDVKAIKADPRPGKKPDADKKPAAAAGDRGPAITPVVVQDGKCCGAE